MHGECHDVLVVSVLQVHPDSASLEHHMRIAGLAFPGFTQMIRMQTIDVYSQPSEELLGLLRQKARMLGDIPVAVHTRQAGFMRLGPS